MGKSHSPLPNFLRRALWWSNGKSVSFDTLLAGGNHQGEMPSARALGGVAAWADSVQDQDNNFMNAFRMIEFVCFDFPSSFKKS